MDKENNVIQFPKRKKDSPLQSLEEIQANVQSVRKQHIHTIVAECMEHIFDVGYEENYNLAADKQTTTMIMLTELFLQAALFGAAGLPHPMHELKEFVQFVEVDDVNKLGDGQTPTVEFVEFNDNE